MDWPRFAYEYDGSFAGFLTCVFEAYARKEEPACFLTHQDGRVTLWPARAVDTDDQKARRVYRSLDRSMGLQAKRLVTYGFLTCLEERELRLWEFLRLGYERGPSVMRDLTDPRVSVLLKAVRHLTNEAHLLKGFTRFSDQGGVLAGEITPKNRALPLLRPHFAARYPGETIILYDRTHREALFCQKGNWAIVPLEQFSLACSFKGEGQAMREARKHAGWYLKGMRGAAAFRRQAGQLCTLEDAKALARAVLAANPQQ